jgi:hypothetical protein
LNNITARPPAAENPEADNTSQAVKRRLPREIKLKLAKVARLAVLLLRIYIRFYIYFLIKGFELYNINCMFLLQQASHGKVSKELINRLMSILGHLMQLRTLKVLQLLNIHK